MFPKEFGRYIEIFGGSGAVLLGKEPSKFEVYNDIEGELVNFFRVVKNRPAELLLELDLLPLNSREEFEALENFRVENARIVESWGYWPDREIEQKLKE